jgi:hypothetical protein
MAASMKESTRRGSADFMVNPNIMIGIQEERNHYNHIKIVTISFIRAR